MEILVFFGDFMARLSSTPLISHGVVSQNRRATYDYTLIDRVEAGLVLTGSEVKSLRMGQVQLRGGHVVAKGNELFLINVTIKPYAVREGHLSHEEMRPRKLLLHAREVRKLVGTLTRDRLTLVPLKVFFNQKGLAKVELGLARGKKLYDKREATKHTSWQRDKARLLREKK